MYKHINIQIVVGNSIHKLYEQNLWQRAVLVKFDSHSEGVWYTAGILNQTHTFI